MARLRRTARLETREGRTRLKAQPRPYWKQLELGIAIGYRRNKTGSGTWIVRRFVEGKHVQTRLGLADDYDDGDEFLSYKQAHRLAIGHADTSAALARDGIDSAYTVATALQDYMAWYAVQRKGAATIQSSVDAHIIAKFGPRRVSDLTTKEIRTWHQGLAKGRTRTTANRVLTILRAALNRAWKDGHVASADAWRRVEPFRDAQNEETRALSADEARRLLNACAPDLRDIAHASLMTAGRYGELRAMRVEDYHPDVGTVTIRASKTGGPRHVPLTDEGRELFDRLTAGNHGHMFTKANGEPWGKDDQARPMRAACERGNVEPRVSFRSLRTTYGSLLAMADAPMHAISKAMGHSDMRMTMRHYAHLQSSYVAETVRKHLPSFGGKKTNVKRLRKAR